MTHFSARSDGNALTDEDREEALAQPEAGNGSRTEPEPPARKPAKFRRRRTWVSTVFALPFVAGCLGVVLLIGIFRWPRANVPVFYVTVRPAWMWFAGLLPFLAIGVFGVRKRWVAAGILLWAVGLCACDDIQRTFRPFSGRAQRRFASAHMAFRSFVEQGGAPDSVPLRIVTWNVQGGRRGPDEAIEQLATLAPDLVFFQEYQWGGRRTIARAIEDNPEFAEYHLDDQDRLAILSRFPVKRLPRNEMAQYRGAAWEIEPLPGRRIICINAHMPPLELRTQIVRGISWAMLEENILKAREHLERLSAAIDRYRTEAPVIIAGDLNLPSRYADLRRATNGLKEAFASGGYGWPYTVPANHKRIPFPILRVDAIFVPEDAKVFRTRAVPTLFSDHYPMLTETRIPLGTEATDP